MLMNLRDRSAELGTTLRIEDDHGVIDLPPLPARAAPPHAAPPDPPLGSPPAPWPAPPADCVVPAVPDEARIEPLAIGPLILLGVSVEPRELTEETRLRLDTYWQVDAPVASDLSLAVQIEPLPRNGLSWGDDHEPCDWMWPTSRWTPGTIYRDRCDLLPQAGHDSGCKHERRRLKTPSSPPSSSSGSASAGWASQWSRSGY